MPSRGFGIYAGELLSAIFSQMNNRIALSFEEKIKLQFVFVRAIMRDSVMAGIYDFGSHAFQAIDSLP